MKNCLGRDVGWSVRDVGREGELEEGVGADGGGELVELDLSDEAYHRASEGVFRKTDVRERVGRRCLNILGGLGWRKRGSTSEPSWAEVESIDRSLPLLQDSCRLHTSTPSRAGQVIMKNRVADTRGEDVLSTPIVRLKNSCQSAEASRPDIE